MNKTITTPNVKTRTHSNISVRRNHTYNDLVRHIYKSKDNTFYLQKLILKIITLECIMANSWRNYGTYTRQDLLKSKAGTGLFDPDLATFSKLLIESCDC